MAKLFPAVLVIAIVVALSVVFFLLPGRPSASQTPSSTSGQSTTTSQTSSYTSSPATSSTTSQTSSSTSAQTTAEYVVAEYLPGEYSGTKSSLNYGEVNYNLRYDYSFSAFLASGSRRTPCRTLSPPEPELGIWDRSLGPSAQLRRLTRALVFLASS